MSSAERAANEKLGASQGQTRVKRMKWSTGRQEVPISIHPYGSVCGSRWPQPIPADIARGHSHTCHRHVHITSTSTIVQDLRCCCTVSYLNIYTMGMISCQVRLSEASELLWSTLTSNKRTLCTRFLRFLGFWVWFQLKMGKNDRAGSGYDKVNARFQRHHTERSQTSLYKMLHGGKNPWRFSDKDPIPR